MPELNPQMPGGNAEPKAPKRADVAKNAEPKAPGLPDADSIDPTKITRAVLTKDGYVCPLRVGSK